MNLTEFLNKYHKEITNFDGKFVYVEILEADRNILTDNNINYDKIYNRIDIINPFENLYIYRDDSDFVKRHTADKFDGKKILILGSGSNYSLKKDNQSVRSEKILNYQAYKLIVDLLCKSTTFMSFHDNINNELVLISQEKGVNHIKYYPRYENALEMNELPILYSKLKNSFERVEYQSIFREVILETIPKHIQEERFHHLITSLSALVDLAERDFQIYVRKFGFDQIKTKFKEERNKYFESIEKNIDSINKQVVSFPLTFSATVFASYQVKNNGIVLVLIFIAYVLYTIIAFKILNISRDNISNVFNDMISEAKKIIKSYDIIFIEFKPEFKKILNKVRQINNLICVLRITLWFLIIIFLVFVVWNILHPNIEVKHFDSFLVNTLFSKK